MSLEQRFDVSLPGWVEPWVRTWQRDHGAAPDSAEQRMRLAIGLAAENVRHGTGGPFGATVVERASGRLIGVGVNGVTRSRLSVAHAEIVALGLAQRAVGSWNLAEGGQMELVTSCEPCAMCFGAVPWTGIASVVCGARREDAEAAGFDEGDKPENWVATLERRGIDVTVDVLRTEAADVLRVYAETEGAIYHPSRC
jgi:tRNA(Arg) A34 adenosine deaminase TadA